VCVLQCLNELGECRCVVVANQALNSEVRDVTTSGTSGVTLVTFVIAVLSGSGGGVLPGVPGQLHHLGGGAEPEWL